MANDTSSPATENPNSQKLESTTPISILKPNSNSSPTPPPPQQHSQPQDPTQRPVFQPAQLYAPPSQNPGSLVSNLPPAPPFRPGMQFTPAANFQNPPSSGVPSPGVNSLAAPGSMPPYQMQPGQMQNPNVMRPFQPMANGYPGIPGVGPPGAIPPPAS